MSDPSVAGGVRTAAGAAALVLAVSSHGDALVLALLLVVAAWRAAALPVLPALVAVSWRWGSTSLGAWAGAQAVLGPAGVVGPPRAAAACWLAATTVVLTAPAEVGGMGAPWRRTGAPNLGGWVMAGTMGAVGACIVAGPALGGAVWVRVAATAVGVAIAVVVGWARARRPVVRRVSEGLGAVAGLGALAVASIDAPAWSGTVDADAIVAGALIAAAVAGLVVVAGRTVAALRVRPA